MSLEKNSSEKPRLEKIPDSSSIIAQLKKQGLEKHAKSYEKILLLANEIKKQGGRIMLVGGAVRDFACGKISKDFDLEIYGLPSEKIKEIVLAMNFQINEVGAAFGILKIFCPGGIDLDLSLPRTDNKVGVGHDGFTVKTDPFLSITEAARRRDFTINSMCADPLNGEIFDPFGGYEDLQNKLLKITDKQQFGEDPLRVLRGIQFAARFGLQIDKETALLMQKTAPEMQTLSKERFFEEWKKLLLKATKPSIGLVLAMGLNILKHIHPELPLLAKTKQDKLWHPEGDVWIHTLMTIDEAAKIIRRENLLENDEDKALTIMLGALCHDFGKPATTLVNENGRTISPGHEAAGYKPTEKFLDRITAPKKIQDKVINLVKYHLSPSMFYIDEFYRGKKISDGAIRKLAKKIYPATIEELVLVAEADHLGRGQNKDSAQIESILQADIYQPKAWLLEKAQKLQVLDSRPTDLLRGQDLLIIGLTPGKDFGEIISIGNELRDDFGFDKDRILKILAGSKNSAEALNHLKEQLLTRD